MGLGEPWGAGVGSADPPVGLRGNGGRWGNQEGLRWLLGGSEVPVPPTPHPSIRSRTFPPFPLTASPPLPLLRSAPGHAAYRMATAAATATKGRNGRGHRREREGNPRTDPGTPTGTAPGTGPEPAAQRERRDPPEPFRMARGAGPERGGICAVGGVTADGRYADWTRGVA